MSAREIISELHGLTIAELQIVEQCIVDLISRQVTGSDHRSKRGLRAERIAGRLVLTGPQVVRQAQVEAILDEFPVTWLLDVSALVAHLAQSHEHHSRVVVRPNSRCVTKMACLWGVRYDRRMTADDVKALSIDRKIQIMEAIWEDFRDRFDRMEVSQEQKALLDQRRARSREGIAQILDWDSVKGTIGR